MVSLATSHLPPSTAAAAKSGVDYVKLMGYGYVDENNEPQVTDGLLEGGIVAIYYFGTPSVGL
jgi:hypothetical protein